jgi:hypothetical protein
MRTTRTLLSVWLVMLVATVAHAANFTFSGKFTSSRGKIINIPVVGNTPCAPLTLRSGPGEGGTMTPYSHMIQRGVNTQPNMIVTPYYQGPGRDLLCVGHVAGKKLATDGQGTAMGKGGGFVMPANAFTKPLPPYVRAVGVKYAPPLEQLATSFKVSGPASARSQPVGGTMANGMNTAALRVFKQGAWKTQTGRAGSMFTWCPASPVSAGKGGPCTNINQAGPNLIVRYTGGGNAFGGTMGYLVSSGPHPSSLAIGISGGAVAFQILSGKGSQVTGRGYADFMITPLKGGSIRATHQLMSVYEGPILKTQRLITKLGLAAGTFPSGTNFAWGFPLTTRTVLVRDYLTRTTTLTAKGGDVITAMGARNLSLVAGGLAVAKFSGIAPQHTPEILSMMLPEPGKALQLAAGIAALLAIAGWRSRRSR